MADVFISYARADKARVAPIVAGIEEHEVIANILAQLQEIAPDR